MISSFYWMILWLLFLLLTFFECLRPTTFATKVGICCAWKVGGAAISVVWAVKNYEARKKPWMVSAPHLSSSGYCLCCEALPSPVTSLCTGGPHPEAEGAGCCCTEKLGKICLWDAKMDSYGPWTCNALKSSRALRSAAKQKRLWKSEKFLLRPGPALKKI